MAGKIFINYRRDDDPSAAARVCDSLSAEFGAQQLFMDVNDLLAGSRFEEELNKALADCDVFIPIIGARWADLLKVRQRSKERDYVREEIAEALKRRIIVIPVRVGREGHLPPLPREIELPTEIRNLIRYQKQDVTHEHFARDVAALRHAIKSLRTRDQRGIAQYQSTDPADYIDHDRAHGYLHLKQVVVIETVPKIGSSNLVTDQDSNIIRDLSALADRAFSPNQHVSSEAADLSNRQPNGGLTPHQRLQERDIENKFPIDAPLRALMGAFTHCVARNSKIYVAKGLAFQFLLTLPFAIFAAFWFSLAGYLSALIALPMRSMLQLGASHAEPSTVLAAIVAAAFGVTASYLMRRLLQREESEYERVTYYNSTILGRNLASTASELRALFYKTLMEDIAASSANYDAVSQGTWPSRAKAVFRAGLWVGKRLEYLQTFWSIQLDKLSSFFSITRTTRYLSVRLFGVAVVGLSCLIHWHLYGLREPFSSALIFAVEIAVAFRLSQLASSTEYQLGMHHIDSRTKDWQPFEDLGVYDRIAEQFERDKSQYQMSIKRDSLYAR